MSNRNSLRPRTTRKLSSHDTPRFRSLHKQFADLKIRPKLIVLHNLFFLILTVAVYFTLIPSYEKRVANAKAVEIALIKEIFAGERVPEQIAKGEGYDFREGSAAQVQASPDIQSWLVSRPGEVYQDPARPSFLYRFDPKSKLYRRITLPDTAFDDVVDRARVALFAVLGTVYVLAVLTLELIIMPLYVYRPIKLCLDADEATRTGDRTHELIDESLIPQDEIGQIMRSRNRTVAELRNHEDHLEKALERLEAQDRLASLGMLSASVAHEMNTPLAVLHGSIEKLIETVPDPQAQERLGRMVRVTRRLKTISEGLVDFARVRRQVMEPVNVRSVIEEAWSLVAIDEKSREVRWVNGVPADAEVTGNADRLIQVFVNLLRNALIAVEAGGLIEASAKLCSRKGDSAWVITIDDDGPGIPADVLPEIFDAFVSSRLDSRGTGLGLTVAQGIVDQHGGSIHASNRAGGGARLEVTLPAVLQQRSTRSADAGS